MMDFITDQEKGGMGEAPKSSTYLDSYIKILNSWLTHNGKTPIRGIKLGNKNHRPTIENERVPTKSELKQVFHYAKTRGRVCIALLRFQVFVHKC